MFKNLIDIIQIVLKKQQSVLDEVRSSEIEFVETGVSFLESLPPRPGTFKSPAGRFEVSLSYFISNS